AAFRGESNGLRSNEDLEALQSLQSGFQKCINANGLGLEAAATGRDYCKVSINFPKDTILKWLLLHGNKWVRNSSSTLLTKEYIDALPNGWEDYAWRRINKGIQLNRCQNKSLCIEKLSSVLPETPPYFPGSLGDVLLLNYKEYVGEKSTFRLLNRGSAKALDKVVELDGTV
ncbi:hypothetical protein HID58_002206, partial [Brassica napus]